jgi:hypothetical protein
MNEQQIIYPTVEVFFFDLREGLGDSPEEIEVRRRNFYEKIYGENTYEQGDYPKFCDRDNPTQPVVLLEKGSESFPNGEDGQYYPVQLGDTYALVASYSGKFDAHGQANTEPHTIQPATNHPSEIGIPFGNFQGKLQERLHQKTPTLGQTWLIYGKIPDPNADLTQVAQQCYQQMVVNPNWHRDCIGEGSLQGGTLFEIWHSDSQPSQSAHILIWLFPASKDVAAMREEVPASWWDFLYLFQYRHKILWAYAQSRYLRKQLKQNFVELKQKSDRTQTLPQEIDQGKIPGRELQNILTENLATMSNYTVDLNYLDDQRRNIDINIQNYRDRFFYMQQKYPNSDLQCLGKFSESEIYAKKYQRQITADYENLQPGLTVLQNLNNTISGIIHIEQTKVDRRLNNTVAIVGVGLATSSLAASVALEGQNPPDTHTDFQFLTDPAFTISLGIGVFSAVLVAVFLRFRR